MMKKINLFVSIILLIFCMNNIRTYAAYWYPVEQINGFIWLNDDFTYPKGTWCLIDDDNDGYGYYYYFDEIGKLLVDTITPDYRIVDSVGRRTLLNGDAERIDMNEAFYNEDDELMMKFYNDAQKSVSNFGIVSSGTIGIADVDGILPNLGAENKYLEGTTNKILGKNVVLKEKDNKDVYDSSIDHNCVKYITAGSNYSKKVNGTTFSKIKWKGVIALKGTESYFDVENPKNNFNRVRGKIATHYFTYSDRTTMCRLIVSNENGDELYSTNSFNYNNGTNMDFTFPKKTKKLRFELVVDGEYTSRVAYIKDLNFLFNRKAYNEEHEEDLEEAQYQEYRRSMGLIDDETEAETEEYDDELEEDINDEENSNDIDSADNTASGPAFDTKLKVATVSKAGPNGTDSIKKGTGGD